MSDRNETSEFILVVSVEIDRGAGIKATAHPVARQGENAYAQRRHVREKLHRDAVQGKRQEEQARHASAHTHTHTRILFLRSMKATQTWFLARISKKSGILCAKSFST